MAPRSSEGIPLKAVLLLGFGLTLGLWLLAGYQYTRRIADMQLEGAEINRRYMDAQERLAAVRGHILIATVYVRDALLDASPAIAELNQKLSDALTLADQTLTDYEPVFDDSREERERIGQLRAEVAEFRSSAFEVIGSSTEQASDDVRAVLRTRIMPRRDLLVKVSEAIQALNRAGFVHAQNASANLYATTQRRVWAQLGLALLTGLGIALFAAMYAGRLEARLRIQRDREVENAQDLQRLSAKLIRVQEEERRAIARELHDEVGQVLTAIKVELTSAQRRIDQTGGPPGLLANARFIADGALHTVRDLSRLLHPAVLDDLGLPSAIDSQLREFATRHGLHADLHQEGMDQRLAPATEVAAYRVTQEALTNIARHARATACSVSLRRRNEVLKLVIRDNGVGFQPDRIGKDGLGMIGIRERVAQMNGMFRLDTAPGAGTTVIIELPAPCRTSGDDLPSPALSVAQPLEIDNALGAHHV
jgi:signal transduction histidine kinase